MNLLVFMIATKIFFFLSVRSIIVKLELQIFVTYPKITNLKTNIYLTEDLQH
jgi:hypothetical protein